MVADAIASGWIAPLGPHVDGFEAELAARCGVKAVAALSSGTAALHLGLLQLGVGAGDRVFCSSLTFAASANAIAYIGATPVFIDSEMGSWNMCPELLQEALTDAAASGELPRAVLVVDLYGQCADYDRLAAVCDAYEVPLLSDAAESLGATYKGRAAGSLGAMAAVSFNGNKIITTSGGGALLCHSEEDASRARFLATQARDPAPHYQHSTLGYNYRLSNLLAAVGRAQLKVLDERVAARRAIRERYREAFGAIEGVELAPEAEYGESNAWLTCALVDEDRFGTSPARIVQEMSGQEIEVRPVWKPMHQQPYYLECRMFGGRVADELFARGICLPSGSSLTRDEQDRVIGALLDLRRGA